jgi:hypothetical protein
METSQDKIKATMKKNNEKMEAAIHSMKAWWKETMLW